jgi:hypothetical protein
VRFVFSRALDSVGCRPTSRFEIVALHFIWKLHPAGYESNSQASENCFFLVTKSASTSAITRLKGDALIFPTRKCAIQGTIVFGFRAFWAKTLFRVRSKVRARFFNLITSSQPKVALTIAHGAIRCSRITHASSAFTQSWRACGWCLLRSKLTHEKPRWVFRHSLLRRQGP